LLGGLGQPDTNTGGNLNAINALLTVNGQGAGDSDLLMLDDTGDTLSNHGTLTATRITNGVVGSSGPGAADGRRWQHHLRYAGSRCASSWATRPTAMCSPSKAPTATDRPRPSAAASVADVFNIETLVGDLGLYRPVAAATWCASAPRPAMWARRMGAIDAYDSSLNGLAGRLEVDGGTGSADTLKLFDGGDTTRENGRLSASEIVGMGMTLGVGYTGFDVLKIWLSNGDDNLYIASTHTGVTFIDLGDEQAIVNGVNDVVNINSTSGPTTIDAGQGNDVIRVNFDVQGSRPSGAASMASLRCMASRAATATKSASPARFRRASTHSTSRTAIPASTACAFTAPTRPTSSCCVPTRTSASAWWRRSRSMPTACRSPAASSSASTTMPTSAARSRSSGATATTPSSSTTTSRPTTIFGDAGNDTFQAGQVYQSFRDARNPDNGLAEEDYFETTQITRGFLSNGVSQSTVLYGGTGNDNFTVYSNKAELFLFGDEDDDTFTVRAFVKVDPNDPKAPYTNINGGQGADFIAFTVNAPVRIDGGDGFDTLTVIGTEFGDDFVVNDQGVYGAGLFVSYTGLEKIVVDALEGNDRFFIESTSAGVALEVVGGLGSDTLHVGGSNGKAVTVVSNKLEGHSGLVIQSTTTDDPAYKNVFVKDVVADVRDNDEARCGLCSTSGRSACSRTAAPAPTS
jgi:hypothetical protein